ncbi:MAG: mannose-1-phosphate guanylyltransferase [Treponema sp.]|jgi:mannose-1-phosphate guanylyltransferase/mannose-6-phosphate isomerase|nr:mannose-1-phosphate guanylyltransferase [Treponema sp.]
MFNDCIIMAGGFGTRLWPVSNSRRPKQFLSIARDNTKEQSFFSSAVARAFSVIEERDGRVIVISGRSHVPHIVEACSGLSAAEKKRLVLIPEPMAKSTAPAIACSVLYSDWVSGLERNMLILTSDHIIQPLASFRVDASAAAFYAQQDKLVVFGIPPTKPETGYGYIETGEPLSVPRGEGGLREPDAYKVTAFREKPDLKTAEKFAASKHFYWNSGMFAFSSKFILGEFRRLAPEVIQPFDRLRAPDEKCYTSKKGIRILQNWPDLENAYRRTRAISFDYAIAEKCSQTLMVSAGFNWTDVGDWEEYARLLGKTGAEVYSAGPGGKNQESSCFVDSDIPVALAGVEDLIVVVRSGKDGGVPAVLVAKKGETRYVRDIVEQIKKAGRTDLL